MELVISYRGKDLRCFYRADFICFESVLVELKALETLTPAAEAQLINYLKAAGLRRGLLLNFGSPRLQYKRMVFG